MKRRQFLRASALAAAASPALTAAEGSKIDRVACTTTTFRGRFPAMPVLEFPKFIAKELGLKQVEIWTKHLTDTTDAFFNSLAKAASDAGSRVINLQLDQPGYDLSATSPKKRSESVDFVRRWMDRAKLCGANSLRANTGGRRGSKFVAAETNGSFAQLAEHGSKIGLVVLVENHGGHSAKAENIVQIVDGVASSHCRSLPDFGNVDGTQDEREDFLAKILPHAHLISAKGREFDDSMKHLSFDIGSCVRLAEKSGFAGVYSIEQWSKAPPVADGLSIAKHIRDIILENLR